MHCDHGNLARVGALQLVDVGQLLYAGRAVGRPEVDEGGLAPLVRQMEVAAIIAGCREIRKLLALRFPSLFFSPDLFTPSSTSRPTGASLSRLSAAGHRTRPHRRVLRWSRPPRTLRPFLSWARARYPFPLLYRSIGCDASRKSLICVEHVTSIRSTIGLDNLARSCMHD